MIESLEANAHEGFTSRELREKEGRVLTSVAPLDELSVCRDEPLLEPTAPHRWARRL